MSKLFFSVFAVSFLFAGLIVSSACAPKTTVRQKQAISAVETKHVESDLIGPKRRVGIIDFENKTPYEGRVGQAASDILITELAKTNRFVLIEREKMAQLLDEQKLGQTGIIDPATVAKTGRMLGLNAVITGSVSHFGARKEGSDYLLAQTKRQVVEATVDIRVVDVETGQVLLADSGKGVAQKSTGQLLGMGTRSSYDETMDGEALRAAIVKFTDNIISQINARPWSCRVAAVKDGDIYLNAGSISGVGPETRLRVFHLGDEIIDPVTNISLGNEEKEIGVVVVIRNFGEDGSVARLVSGAFPVRNDICRLEKK